MVLEKSYLYNNTDAHQEWGGMRAGHRPEELCFCEEKEGNQATLVDPLLQVHSSLLMSPNSATLGLISSMFLVCSIRKLNKYHCNFEYTFISMVKYMPCGNSSLVSI